MLKAAPSPSTGAFSSAASATRTQRRIVSSVAPAALAAWTRFISDATSPRACLRSAAVYRRLCRYDARLFLAPRFSAGPVRRVCPRMQCTERDIVLAHRTGTRAHLHPSPPTHHQYDGDALAGRPATVWLIPGPFLHFLLLPGQDVQFDNRLPRSRVVHFQLVAKVNVGS